MTPIVTARRSCRGLLVQPLEIDADNGCACVADRSIAMTATEMQVLLALATRARAVIPKWRLMEDLGFTTIGGFKDRRIDVHVSNVRAKLCELAPAWTFIHTHVGVGYRFDPTPAPPRN